MEQGLVFDMDGLIFDTERIVKQSWDEDVYKRQLFTRQGAAL